MEPVGCAASAPNEQHRQRKGPNARDGVRIQTARQAMVKPFQRRPTSATTRWHPENGDGNYGYDQQLSEGETSKTTGSFDVDLRLQAPKTDKTSSIRPGSTRASRGDGCGLVVFAGQSYLIYSRAYFFVLRTGSLSTSAPRNGTVSYGRAAMRPRCSRSSALATSICTYQTLYWRTETLFQRRLAASPSAPWACRRHRRAAVRLAAGEPCAKAG